MKKFGFEEVPLDDCIYERADIKMEKFCSNKGSFEYLYRKQFFLIFA
jgi:hypothetical protein